MSIRKKRGSNEFIVEGREMLHLHCYLTSGETVQLSIQIGMKDREGKC